MSLDESRLKACPVEQFREWSDEAQRLSGMTYPNALCLSTISPAGTPEGRMVLLRSFDSSGFVFFTNLHSQKGNSLKENPRAAMTFYWDELQRQVRIQGTVVPVSKEEADEYFATRHRNSQLGAWASTQSAVLANREELEQRFQMYEKRFQNSSVPRPPHWSGFRLVPEMIEFWQEREFRLHDRFRYQKSGDTWVRERLSP